MVVLQLAASQSSVDRLTACRYRAVVPHANPNLMRLGAAIRAARTKPGWSQEKLADEAKIHRSYAGAVERGERNAGFLTLLKLRNALGLSWKEFGAILDRFVHLSLKDPEFKPKYKGSYILRGLESLPTAIE